MNKVSLLLILFAAAFSAQTMAQSAPTKSQRVPQYQIAKDRVAALNFELAPIKGAADLALYLNENRNTKTPLDHLSKFGRKQFLDSIVFTASGIGSFDPTPLRNELTPTESFAILSLFGLQHKTHVVKNRRVATKADMMLASPDFCDFDPDSDEWGDCGGNGGGGGGGIGGGGGGSGPISTDYPGYKCDGKATCEKSYDQSICIGDNCGKK